MRVIERASGQTSRGKPWARKASASPALPSRRHECRQSRHRLDGGNAEVPLPRCIVASEPVSRGLVASRAHDNRQGSFTLKRRQRVRVVAL